MLKVGYTFNTYKKWYNKFSLTNICDFLTYIIYSTSVTINSELFSYTKKSFLL